MPFLTAKKHNKLWLAENSTTEWLLLLSWNQTNIIEENFSNLTDLIKIFKLFSYFQHRETF